MAFTRVVGAGIHTAANINSHNIKSTGIVTATKFDGPFDNLVVSGSISIGGTLTYEDVTNVDSIGIITARSGVNVTGGQVAVGNNIKLGNAGVITATTFTGTTGNFTNLTGTLSGVSTNFVSAVGIQSAGTVIGAGITQLNFIGLGNTFAVNGTTVDVSISGNAGAGGTWSSYTAGIATTKSVGINTNNLDDNDLVGVGNSFQGLYISNGMMIMDNKLHGNHYIGTAFNGMMAGPVTIEGTLTIDGNYVVV